ncbi:pre-60S factor rei1 [Fusarium falciforme]|nr:pre-60S factor rei1 [Fusarium falciforme]
MKEENKEKEEPKKEEPEQLTEEEMAERVMQKSYATESIFHWNNVYFVEHNKHFKDVEENLEHMFRTHGFYIPEQKYLVDKIGLVKYMSEKIGLGNICIVCNYQGKNIDRCKTAHVGKETL